MMQAIKIFNGKYGMIKTEIGLSLCMVLTCMFIHLEAADLIIFSYNRPLQLDALLYSTHRHIEHINTTHVVYRASSDLFQAAYEEISAEYPAVQFVRQQHPPHDFKPLLLHILAHTPSPYICFAVDDNIVTESFDMQACTQALAQSGAYGFYLRLGKNITYSYTQNIPLTTPELKEIAQDIYLFGFTGKSYWAYPNTVDMTIYKKEDILPALHAMNYTSPNRLEAQWHRIANLQHNGLCFGHSKMLNTPLNIVQEDWYNKHESTYTPEELLAFWQQGLRLDTHQLHNAQNSSAHIDHIPHFITRSHP